MRRWLFAPVFLAAMLLGQPVFAAASGVAQGVVSADAILVGVITVAVFLWIYSLIA